MKTLFVEQPNMELRYQRACLLLYQDGKQLTSIPLCQLERIVVAPHITLTAGVLGLVTEKSVALMVLNNRYPTRTAVLAGAMVGNVRRRVRQYQLYQDSAFKGQWAKIIVRLKISRQRQFLYQLQQDRADLRYTLTHAIDAIDRILTHIACQTEQDLAHLLGQEGAAAAIYFNALKSVFPPALNFNGRNRRPPKDPVNVCLSLIYTLIYHEAVSALKTSGLDPALGCLHKINYNRDSFACDLLEPLRPWLDVWVYRLFKTRTIRVEDFSTGRDCLFKPAGKKRFYQAYQQIVPIYRRLLRRYARIASRVIH